MAWCWLTWHKRAQRGPCLSIAERVEAVEATAMHYAGARMMFVIVLKQSALFRDNQIRLANVLAAVNANDGMRRGWYWRQCSRGLPYWTSG